MVKFWQEIFDAKISDFIEDRISGVNLKFTFLRVNPRHHSIAVGATRGVAMDPFATKIQHLEMQVATLDDVAAGLPALPRARLQDRNGGRAAYQRPRRILLRGDAVRLLFRARLEFHRRREGEAWPQVVHQGISLWGHKPQDHTLGDQLAQLGNGVMSLFRNEYAPF